MNLLDIILLLLLAWAGYRGYKRGIVGTVSIFAGYILGLLGTALFYWPLQIFLARQLHLVEKLSPWVITTLEIPAASQQITSFPIDIAVDMINEKDMPDTFKEIMVKYVRDFADLPVSKGINSLSEGIGYIVSDFIISALSFVILAVVLSAFFRILLPRLFNAAAPRPVTTVDKAGGTVLGLAGGFLSTAALVLMLTPLGSLGALKGNPSLLSEQVHTSFMVNAVMARLASLFEMIFASKGF